MPQGTPNVLKGRRVIVSRVAVAVAAVVATGAGVLVGLGTAGASEAPSAQAAVSSDAASATAKASPAAEPSTSPTGTEGSYAGKPQVTQARKRNGVTVQSKITTPDPVFFITIDDGWNQQPEALDYVQSTKLPVTSFLTRDAVGGNWDYFSEFSKFDAVQNHTMTHKALSKSSTDREYEICEAQKVYEGKYGSAPWILRPPYGAGFMPERPAASDIEKVSASCGIKHIALWNVTVSKEGKMEFAGTPYRRGDIVLLHFEGDLAANLKALVKAYAKHGLKPASLSDYLAR